MKTVFHGIEKQVLLHYIDTQLVLYDGMTMAFPSIDCAGTLPGPRPHHQPLRASLYMMLLYLY